MICKVQNTESFEGKILSDFIEKTPGISLYLEGNQPANDVDVLFLDIDNNHTHENIVAKQLILLTSETKMLPPWLRQGHTNFLEKSALSYDQFLVMLEKINKIL